LFDKLRYAYEVGHETDWINLVVDNIRLSGIDINKLLEDDPSYLIKRGNIKNLYASVYRDKKLPFPEGKSAPLPQETLRNLKTPLAIDSFLIQSANITYQELSESAFEPGELKFQDLEILLTNMTNIPSKISANKNMSLNIYGNIEGTELI